MARQYNIQSAFGTFLDPIADKIFIGVLIVALAALGRVEGLWIIPALIIITREFLISGLREYLGPKNIQMPVSNLAKWKTTIQMIALGFLVYGGSLLTVGQVALCFAAILTVITGYSYVKIGFKHIK